MPAALNIIFHYKGCGHTAGHDSDTVVRLVDDLLTYKLGCHIYRTQIINGPVDTVPGPDQPRTLATIPAAVRLGGGK